MEKEQFHILGDLAKEVISAGSKVQRRAMLAWVKRGLLLMSQSNQVNPDGQRRENCVRHINSTSRGSCSSFRSQ